MKALFFLTRFFILDLFYKKIILVSFLLSTLFIIISVLLGPLSYEEESRLTINFSLAGSQIALIFLSVLLGASLIKEDITSKSIHGFLTSPIGRDTYILSKSMAFSLTLLFMTGVMWFSFFLAGFVVGMEFSVLQSFIPFLGIYLEALLLFSVALCSSLFLSFLTTVSLAFSLFFAGHWLDTLGFLAEKASSTFIKIVAWLLVSGLPHLENLNWKAHLTYSEWASPGFYFTSSIQALFWVGFFQVLALIIFFRKDLA